MQRQLIRIEETIYSDEGARGMKKDELGTLAVSISSAGKSLGLGRNSAYEAAKRGEIPTIRIGGRLLVPIEALRRMLADADRKGNGA